MKVGRHLRLHLQFYKERKTPKWTVLCGIYVYVSRRDGPTDRPKNLPIDRHELLWMCEDEHEEKSGRNNKKEGN